jgi:hypothetical protein
LGQRRENHAGLQRENLILARKSVRWLDLISGAANQGAIVDGDALVVEHEVRPSSASSTWDVSCL